jgi:hypothetical protein
MNAREKIAPAHGLLIGWPLRRSPLLDAARLPHNAVEPSMEAS